MSEGRNRIKELRGVRGLTLSDVASHLGVTETTVNRWELHKIEVPRRHWEPLAILFRVQVPWLLGVENYIDVDGNGSNGEERAA